jgi:hypothetical protein
MNSKAYAEVHREQRREQHKAWWQNNHERQQGKSSRSLKERRRVFTLRQWEMLKRATTTSACGVVGKNLKLRRQQIMWYLSRKATSPITTKYNLFAFRATKAKVQRTSITDNEEQ